CVGPHAKRRVRFVGAIGAVGVKASTNVWPGPPGVMLTGVLFVPVTALLVGSVVWKLNVTGTSVTRAGAQTMARLRPALRIVANTVAGCPTCTERLLRTLEATNSSTHAL